MFNFSNKHFQACNNLISKLNEEEAQELLKNLKGWTIVDNKLKKRWEFPNFAKPFNLICKVSEIAEKEGHHPEIRYGWGFAEITIWTHSINGLSKKDFILAAKIDEIQLLC